MTTARSASRIILATLGATTLLATASTASAAVAEGGAGETGPDLIAAEIVGVANYGAVDGVRAYAFGGAHCNIGDEELLFIQNTSQHPVFGNTMFRLADGRFEQVGMSWLQHGFFALQQNLCAPCSPAATGARLGVGCSDVNSANLSGSQSNLGPRFEINASTGAFAFPFASPQGSTGDALFKRLQVREADLAVAGAQFFVEAQYIAPDDALAGNGNNNASYRAVTVNPSNFSLALTGATVREQPAIMAWLDADPGVGLLAVDIPGDGRVYVASRVYDNNDGTFDFEYAIHNLNSHRSVGAVGVQSGGAAITNQGFRAPAYHSGEPYDNQPWAMTDSGGVVTWATDSFDQNPDAFALRWSTLYNFRFTADRAPTDGTMTLSIFRPGGPDAPNAIDITVPVPSGAGCAGDWDNDGDVNVFDVVAFITTWNTGTEAGDFNDDGLVNVFDVVAFITEWNSGCP